ncbi:SPT3 Dosage dependent suppressor of Ty-induced promoter mutations-like protein [Puccinia graminis f. sp. tritici]|uniref:SPT3 Dosage dependent suppressor of Ty-induced promoter mutations-like protein n=1 Tax=Puccinia graminis f. sp. tritici TaxID=56615 RepID=A0A5B0RE65_PUCGR|nr:SPT3 Dosage dependent suppressor of Ty-induced promoter mutations-like protein [Puccinia graminis f. sp. tritici]
MRQLIRMNNQQQPSPESDSDATGSSEGVDYYLQMYFGQSYDGLSALGHRAPPGIAEEGGLDGAIGDGHRMKLDAELASILFGAEDGADCKFPSVDSSDLSPAAHDRLTREAPPAAVECSSAGRWNPDSSQQDLVVKGQQPSQDDDQLRNIHQACLEQSQAADEPEVPGGTISSGRTRTSGSSEDGKQEKVTQTQQTQTQTQTGLAGDSSKQESSPLSYHNFNNNKFPTKFHQDHFNPFLSSSTSTSSSSSSILKNNNNNNNNKNTHSNHNKFHSYFPTTEYTTSLSSTGGSGTTIKDDDTHIKDLKTTSSTNLLNHPISSAISISPDVPYQFTPHHLHPTHSLDTTKFDSPFKFNHHPLSPSFDLLHQMNTSSHPHPQPTKTIPLDLSQFWSSFTPSSAQIDSAKSTDQIVTEDEDRQQPIELEFSHLVAEEQCAPSTPLSSSSFSYEPISTLANGDSSSQSILKSSPKSSGDFSKAFIPADPLSSLYATTDPGTSLYPPPISTFQELRDFNDNFHNLINSFDLFSPSASSTRHSVSSAVHPPPPSAPFLSTTASASIQSTPAVDPTFGSQTQTSPSVDHLAHHKFESSLSSTSPLPSPASLSYPSVPTPQSANRDQFPPGSEVAHPNYHKNNLLINRSASYSALNKSITAAAEVPTEVELAIPRLDQLNLSEPYPDDLKLLLIGLQAEGAKTRVETQIKLTLVLVTGDGASIDQNGNLSTPTQHSLSRLGNWSHIKLPVYSAIKRKSKKLIKTGIPPEETLFLDVAVVRESEPHEEIYCCSNCQVREQKRLQRKRDARVRPAQEIESDEAEQSIRPEDEKRKIVVFNCGQYVSFDSGEVTLPTRITCYCRHHREKKGFRVKITLRDHNNRFVATSTTPAIMITDDHKAVAAAAKAKSGSDAEDSQTRTRPIRKLPNAGPGTSASGTHRTKRKSFVASIDSTSNNQLASTPIQDNGSFDSTAGWTASASATPNENTTYLHSQLQGSSQSTSTKCKRKAPDELNLRVNVGRRTGSHQTATNNHLVGPRDASLAHQNLEFGPDYQVIAPSGSSRSFEECGLQLADQSRSRSYDRSISMPMSIPPPDTQQADSASKCQWKDCSSIPQQSYPDQNLCFARPEVKPTLSIDVEMKDSSVNAHSTSQPADNPPQSMTRNDEAKSNDYPASSDLAEMLHSNSQSRSSELSGKGGHAHSAIQPYQNGYSGPHPSCSTTTSSPDHTRTCPFDSQIATPTPTGSSDASPKSSIDLQGYDLQAKCSISTSRSSSIVCTQSRGGSDGSSNISDVDRTICILPTQSENSPDQQPADQIDTHSNHLNDVSQTGSPAGNSPMCVLGSALSNWNVLSNILPPNLVTGASPKSLSAEVPTKSQQGSVSIEPTRNTNRSQGTGMDAKDSRARIRKLVPNKGPVEGGIEITILGENFDRELRVDFGGLGGPIRPEFWSANTLVCTLPPAAGPGPCEVVLVDGDGPIRVDDASALGRQFRYVCTADQRLMELALQVVGLKMTGQVQDALHFARKIVVETNELDGFDPSASSHFPALVDHERD